MLELINVSHQWSRRDKAAGEIHALDTVHFTLPGGHLAALLGAPGSGKTSIVRLLAGLEKIQSGLLMWKGKDVTSTGLHPGDVGYVPADNSGVQDTLNVKEHVVSAVMLRVAGIERRDAILRADKLLVLCGLDGVGGMRGGKLDITQKRRLAMAMALASDPRLVVCDEFTAGVGPRAERELVALLQQVTKAEPGRVVLNATQSLAELGSYDTVVLLHEGRVCFHGPGRAITHYFSIPHTEDLYHRLAKRPAERWQDSWSRHVDSYYEAFKLLGNGSTQETALGNADDDEDGRGRQRISLSAPKPATAIEAEDAPASTEESRPALPGFGRQTAVLLRRSWTMFRRQRTEWWWQAAMLLIAPLMVFLTAGPALRDMTPLMKPDVIVPAADAHRGGVILAMLFLLQVMLILFGAVKAAAGHTTRSLAALEVERSGGLRVGAWLCSVWLFTAVLLLAQSTVLVLLSELLLGALPGNGGIRGILLVVSSLAFGSLCLGTSAWSKSAEQSESRCWMLAFVNVLLSGALLAWPRALGAVIHPFVTAAQAWSASAESLKATPWYAGLESFNSGGFISPGRALFVLLVHLIIGAVLLVTGVRRRA